MEAELGTDSEANRDWGRPVFDPTNSDAFIVLSRDLWNRPKYLVGTVVGIRKRKVEIPTRISNVCISETGWIYWLGDGDGVRITESALDKMVSKVIKL